MNEHVPPERLALLKSDSLAPDEAESVRQHVASCSTCSLALFELVSGVVSDGNATQMIAGPAPLPPEAPDPAAQLPKGSNIGRYVVLDRLGMGGMGIVYAAFDPELDRKIAIKLLQSQRTGSAGQSWLLREAQAMARLSHPNVIGVHDVGVWNERVFVAMELIEGETLRTWLGRPDRSWRDSAKVMVAAGRGLAAAHAAGIVHRDFKPENVLLGKDGRVCVLDFGLARAAGDEAGAPLVEAAGAPSPGLSSPETGTEPTAPHLTSRPLVSSHLTQAGMVMGTMPYMAPEQLKGRGPDFRSDQFAFAVTLHEVLYGERPFVTEAASHPDRWKLKEPRAAAGVPVWVRRVLVRALASDASARFGSMEELLTALEADPTAGRRRTWQIAAAGAMAVAAVGVTWSVAGNQRERCTGAGGRAAVVWNDERAERVRAAFAATGKAFADTSAASVRRSFDDYLSGWTQRRTEACEATRIRGDESETVLALKNGCLDRRLEELSSLAALFETADAAMVQRAPQAAASLSAVSACADVSTLVGRVQPKDAAAVEQVSRTLAEPIAHLRAGTFSRGLERAAPIVEEARKLGHPPLVAEALLVLGSLQLEAGDPKSAERVLLEAAAFAQEGRADDVGASVWERLAQTGVAAAKFEAARDAARFSSATLARLGGREDLLATLLGTRARVASADGKYAEALTDATTALELQRRLTGEEHPATALAVHTTALAHLKRGELELSQNLFRQALAMREKVLGPNHPDTAASAHGLGSALHSAGKFAEAREQYLRAVQIREVALGSSHSELASTLNNLAALHAMQGQFAEAQPYAERALKILEAVHGPENAYVAFPINNLGNLHKDQGRPEKALEYHLRALAIREKTLGPEHTDVAMSLNNVGECYRAMGRHREALDASQRALAIREKVLPKGHKDLATTLVGTSLTYLRLGRPGDAVRDATRAVEIREAAKLSELDVQDARFVLAQALYKAKKDQVRARQLAADARKVFEAKGDAKRLADVDRWLKENAS